MTRFGRGVERAQARKMFKQFVKQNPQYRAMTFRDFFKLKKAGFVRTAHDHVAHEQKAAEGLTAQDFEDVLLEDIEEVDEVVE